MEPHPLSRPIHSITGQFLTMREFLDLLSWNLPFWNLYPLKLVLGSGWCYGIPSPHGLSHSPTNKFRFINVPLECKCNTVSLAWWSESRDHDLSGAGHSVRKASGGIRFFSNSITQLTHNEFRPNLNHSFLLRIMLNCCWCQQLSSPNITLYTCLLVSVSSHYNASSTKAGALSCSESPAPRASPGP